MYCLRPLSQVLLFLSQQAICLLRKYFKQFISSQVEEPAVGERRPQEEEEEEEDAAH
jgi:hypothetical protein